MLRFSALGSGSKGNGTLVHYHETMILVDCGFTLKETETRLQRLAVAPHDLSAIVVTHEHGDHISGVGALSRKYGIPVYMTAGTWRSGKTGELPQLTLISGARTFRIGNIFIDPISVPHDSQEPVQFRFGAGGRSLGILTDLGSITDEIICHYQSCDAMVLEMNHCVDMLDAGPYPESLKQRVASAWGHLSNDQAVYFLSRIKKNLKHLVIAHSSEQNNTSERIMQALGDRVSKSTSLHIACQRRGFDWLDIPL